jgi:plasmid maintenance system antidote protein VapI
VLINYLKTSEYLRREFQKSFKANRRITADTALRFSKYFGNSAKFWLGLQDDYDIEEAEQLTAKELNLIEHYQSNAA